MQSQQSQWAFFLDINSNILRSSIQWSA